MQLDHNQSIGTRKSAGGLLSAAFGDFRSYDDGGNTATSNILNSSLLGSDYHNGNNRMNRHNNNNISPYQ